MPVILKKEHSFEYSFVNSGDVLLSQAAGTLSQQFSELLVV